MFGLFGILMIGLAMSYLVVGINTFDSQLGWFSEAAEQAIWGLNILAPVTFAVALIFGILGFLASDLTLGDSLGIIITGVLLFVFYCNGLIEVSSLIDIMLSFLHGGVGVIYIIKSYKLNKRSEK